MQEHEEDENDQAHLDSDNEDNPADHEWSLQTQVSIIIIYTLIVCLHISLMQVTKCEKKQNKKEG